MYYEFCRPVKQTTNSLSRIFERKSIKELGLRLKVIMITVSIPHVGRIQTVVSDPAEKNVLY